MEDRDSVFVPKDLSKIKTKFLFGLTRRQCLFFGLGAAVGLPCGWALHRFIMQKIRIDMVSFNVRVAPLSYCLSFLITMLLSVVMCLLLCRKIDRVHMAESLKSVE